MTVEEAKLKYGDPSNAYYVTCFKCPFGDDEECFKDCRDMRDTWEYIAKVMTEREATKPTETDDLELDCDSCTHEHLDDEHPTCFNCGRHGIDNFEEKGCDNCKHEEKLYDEEPCKNCRNCYAEYTDGYKTHPFLWESPYCVPETSKPSETDNVIHPSHYNQGGIECWDAMEAAYGKDAVKHFCICNAFKYLYRHNHKNGMEDIDKAINYLNKYKELSADE